jgi:hypothetical protein
MIRLLKRLLTYIYGDASEPDSPAAGTTSGSATSHLFAKNSPALRRSDEHAGPDSPDTARKTPRPRPPANPDFDPYNTGKFDRGASWERISKKQR